MNKKNLIILLIIIIIIAGNYYLNQTNIFTLDNLKTNRDLLIDYVNSHFLKSIIIYSICYIVIITLALPGAAIMSLAGGMLFSFKYGLIVVVFSAGIGAFFNFIASRFFFQKFLKEHFSKQMTKINKELENHGTNYLFTIRLIPIFPFFLINIAAGLSDIPLKTFLWTTLIGMIPGSILYVYAGMNLAEINAVGDILSPNILLAFLALATFSLIPTFYKKIKGINT